MKRQKGIALLITLSVTLILGIFLANNFERNRTNLKLLSNTESKFSLNTINFSIFKAISLAIKENGANYIYDFVSILGSIPDFPINVTQSPNINIYNPQVWSMQHYYYLNRNFNSKDQQLFNGILNQNLKNFIEEDDGKTISLKEKSFTNDLKQWYGNTANSGLISQFPVYRRNSYFDLDSEFHFFLFENFKKKGKVLKEDFQDELTFRVYSTAGKNKIKFSDDFSGKDGKLCSLSPLNLNMLPKNSQSNANKIIMDYFEWFGFHPDAKCKKIKKSEQNILNAVEKRFYGDKDAGLFLLTDIGGNHFNRQLSGVQTQKETKKYLTYRSNLLGVKYELEHKTTRIKIELHFYLEYKSDNATDIPDTVHILYYNVS